MAAQSGKLTCVELLIKAGADVNTKNRHGCTVLMTAAECQHIQCVEALLHAGALVNICNVYDNALTKYITGKRGQEPNRELCMLLFAAGETVQATNGGYVIEHRLPPRLRRLVTSFGIYLFPEYLKDTSPGLCLKEKCREVIRSHLLYLDPHENLLVRVPRLGLPTSLNKYLLYGY